MKIEATQNKLNAKIISNTFKSGLVHRNWNTPSDKRNAYSTYTTLLLSDTFVLPISGSSSKQSSSEESIHTQETIFYVFFLSSTLLEIHFRLYFAYFFFCKCDITSDKNGSKCRERCM